LQSGRHEIIGDLELEKAGTGAGGMSVETRNSIPSLAQITDAATVFGIVLALGILGMSVGLVRSEAARDLRTLTATGASGTTRRTITAATAGALAFTGAVVGIIGGYLAAIGFFRSNSLDGLSSPISIPVAKPASRSNNAEHNPGVLAAAGPMTTSTAAQLPDYPLSRAARASRSPISPTRRSSCGPPPSAASFFALNRRTHRPAAQAS
jgi:hypothetical protein